MLLAVCQELGIKNDLIPRIASPFAGGMARSGEICGAAAGALMCFGIKHGRDDLTQSDDEALRLSRRFLRAFQEEMGNLRCRDLIGMDISTTEGLQNFRESDVRITVCLRAVGFAYGLTLELLREG